MQINIAVRHGNISEATQAAVREKLEKLPRIYDRIAAMELTLDMEHRDAPEVALKVTSKKHEFHSTERGDNLLAAVDVVVDRMEQQLRKHKEKVQDRHRSTGHREP